MNFRQSIRYKGEFVWAVILGAKQSVCYTEQWVVHCRGGWNILKSMEIRSGYSELYVISQVSVVEGCPLSGFQSLVATSIYIYI